MSRLIDFIERFDAIFAIAALFGLSVIQPVRRRNSAPRWVRYGYDYLPQGTRIAPVQPAVTRIIGSIAAKTGWVAASGNLT